MNYGLISIEKEFQSFHITNFTSTYLHHVLFIVGDVQGHVSVECSVPRRTELFLEGLKTRLVEVSLGHGTLNVIRNQFNVEYALVHNVITTDLAQSLFQGISICLHQKSSN